MTNIKLIISILFLVIYGNIFSQSQNKTVSGYVIDGQTNQPLPFANVIIEDKDLGTTSDRSGYFELNITGKSEKVIVSYLGYKSEKINVNEFSPDIPKIISLYSKGLLLQEVAVFSAVSSKNNRIEASSLSLQSDQIEKIANAMPDVLRSFQALPGISVNNEFSAEFNVRGGNKDENLIRVNGAQVYEPYHIKEAPNASVGVFNVDLIDNVNIITGGFSARYGDRLSSVANIDYREGSLSGYKGAATLSLAFVDGYLEGPLFNKGSFIVGARKTYMEYVIDLTDFGYENIRRADPSFYDIQGLVSYPLSNSDKLRFSFLYSADNFKYNPTSMNTIKEFTESINNTTANVKTSSTSYENQKADYYSTLLDLQSINFLGRNAFLKTSISYYDQRDNEFRMWGTSFNKDILAGNNYFDYKKREDTTDISLTINTLEFQSSLDYQITPFYETKSGFSYKNIIYKDLFDYTKNAVNISNTLTYPDTLIENYGYKGLDYRNDSLKVSSFKLAGYFENIIQIGDNFLINAAGRLDYFDMNKQLTFSPRISAALSNDYGTVIRGAWGHYYQSPIYTQLKYSEASDTNTKAQKAIHYILGIEQNIDLSKGSLSTLKLKVDLYYKDYRNLISSFFSHADRLAYSRENDAVGYARGIDVYALLNIPGFYSWISYSYLVAMEDKTNDDYGEYPRLTGQVHTLAWISDISLGNNWSFNTKLYYGSGYPYAEKVAVYNEDTDEWFWVKEGTNSKYLPEYSRIDFRISKDFNFRNFKLKTFIEISNALNHKNVRGYEYSYTDRGKPIAREIVLWPVLPSFGIRVEF